MTNTYYHGSNSSSLVGVLNKELSGLRPTGDILKSGMVPYSGELNSGISDSGVNRDNISVVPRENINVALDYVRNGDGKWSPIEGKKEIEKLRHYLDVMRMDPSDITDKRDKWMQSVWGEAQIEPAKRKIEIEKSRIVQWRQLNQSEKELIGDSFEVLYGINYEGNVTSVRSGITNECGIRGTVPLNDLTIYVPDERTGSLGDLIYKLDNKPTVLGFRRMKDIPFQSEKAKNSVEYFLKYL